MTPEQQVPTLETCIHAKDRGYPQGKSFFVWVRDGIGNWKLVVNIMLFYAEEKVDAPTLQELLEELYNLCNYSPYLIINIGNPGEMAFTDDYEGDLDWMKYRNPAEAAALLWLELKQMQKEGK